MLENQYMLEKYENFRIQFEINKKQKDAETIRREKTEEEILATQKQIKNTKHILKHLTKSIGLELITSDEISFQ